MPVDLLGNRITWVAIGLGVTLAFGGCSDSQSADSLGGALSGGSADKVAFDYFLGRGLTSIQTAGIVGNLDQESSMNPASIQPGGPGRGIAQWSIGARWNALSGDNATWYAATEGQSVLSLQPQLDFIWYELTTFPGYGLSALKQSRTVATATSVFSKDFEACGECDQSRRVALAQAALNAYGRDTPTPVPAPQPAPQPGPEPDAGVSCFVTALGASGECILASACAALPNHVSTAGFCAGAADVECCTGPSDDAGVPSADAGASSDPGADASSDPDADAASDPDAGM